MEQRNDITTTNEELGLGALMERYVDGDEHAFVDLHGQLASRIRRQVRRKISDVTAAEDLVQAIFLKAHRARGTFVIGEGSDPDRAVAVWYTTIARNAIYDHLRKHYRGRVLLFGGTADQAQDAVYAFADSTASEEATMLERERQTQVVREVRGAVQRLPASQREVVVLHRFKGLSMAEISKRLGVREGTLRVRAHRGYRALENMLLGFKENLAAA